MKTHDTLIRVGDGKMNRPMLTTEILAVAMDDSADYLETIDWAAEQMQKRGIPKCTVYVWDGSEYVVSEWLEA
jgi:hypothetical protein